MQRKRSFAVSFFLTLFVLTSHSQQKSYYVDATGGSDDNAGLSPSAAWKTLAKAASAATAGVTVYIKQGTYNERLVPVNSGTQSAPIEFVAYPGDSVTITGKGISFPAGLSGDKWWTGLVHIQGLRYITLSGVRVIQSGGSGILVGSSSHVTIEQCYTDSTYSPGIAVSSSNNIIVEGNQVVRGCWGGDQECISFSAVSHFAIRGNRIHDGFTEGIDVKVGSSNGIVTRNEVYNQADGRPGIYVEAWDKDEFNIDIYDNVSHDNTQGFVVSCENGGLAEAINIHHNISYGNKRGIMIVGWGVQTQTHNLRNVQVYCNNVWGNEIGIEIAARTGTTMDSIRVYNNFVGRNWRAGVWMDGFDPPSTEIVVRNLELINNTIFANGSTPQTWGEGGLNIFNLSPQNVLVRNNIFSGNASFTVCASPDVPLANFTIDYNLLDGYRGFLNETPGTHADFGSAQFADTLRNDFHLQPTSAAIDKGHPDPMYNDPADPARPGYALYPAHGSIRNDLGAYGGPYANAWDLATSVAKPEPPVEFALRQNYPNPFNPSTTISFGLPQRFHVSLAVYNTIGQQVSQLANGEVEAGYHEVRFDASALATGVYIYRLTAGSFVRTRKMLVVK